MTVSREEFARVVVDQLRALGETRPIVFDEARNRLVVGGAEGTTHFIFLGRALDEYRAAPASTAARGVVARIWSVTQNQPDGPEARERLLRGVVPRIRDRAWFSAIRRQAELELGGDEGAIDELMLPFQPLNEDLAVHLAFELPTSETEIGPDRLQAWGVGFEEVYQRAVENLRERSQQEFEEPRPGVFRSPYRDTLDASRLVLVDRFEALPVKGRPVAIAPTHDVVLVTGDEDEGGLGWVATRCEAAILEPRVNSSITFRLEEGEWVAWLPPKTHPAWTKLKLLQLQTYASVYSRQKEVLEALLQANGHDIDVTAVRVVRTSGGDILTSCEWREGREALLPKTDRVEFVRPAPDGDSSGEPKTWSTTWALAEQLVGSMMQPTGDVPERLRVAEFPDDALLERMAAEGKL